MRKIIPFMILGLITLLTATGLQSQEKRWKLVTDKNGVQVFTRPVPGSDFDEFMGVTVMNARIEELAELLRDIPAVPRWMHNCKEAKILKRITDNEMILYNVTDVPWPLDDRYVIVRSTAEKNFQKGRVIVHLDHLADYPYRAPAGYVRMRSLKAKFIMDFIDRERTKVTYTVKAVPGGSLPASLANIASKELPYRTLLKMKKFVKRDKYVLAGKKSKDRSDIENYLNGRHLRK